jgi:hypothetical protein
MRVVEAKVRILKSPNVILPGGEITKWPAKVSLLALVRNLIGQNVRALFKGVLIKISNFLLTNSEIVA